MNETKRDASQVEKANLTAINAMEKLAARNGQVISGEITFVEVNGYWRWEATVSEKAAGV